MINGMMVPPQAFPQQPPMINGMIGPQPPIAIGLPPIGWQPPGTPQQPAPETPSQPALPNFNDMLLILVLKKLLSQSNNLPYQKSSTSTHPVWERAELPPAFPQV